MEHWSRWSSHGKTEAIFTRRNYFPAATAEPAAWARAKVVASVDKSESEVQPLKINPKRLQRMELPPMVTQMMLKKKQFAPFPHYREGGNGKAGRSVFGVCFRGDVAQINIALIWWVNGANVVVRCVSGRKPCQNLHSNLSRTWSSRLMETAQSSFDHIISRTPISFKARAYFLSSPPCLAHPSTIRALALAKHYLYYVSD